MTNSKDNFALIKEWFAKLINFKPYEQISKIDELVQQKILDIAQANLLKQMLQADKETGLATDIHKISESIIEDSSSESLESEQQIGSFKIIETLGKGGMGHVYLAQRNDGQFQQQVALKLPHLNFNPSMKRRFENERQILAQLTHENIARLLDGGTTANNQPYLVMEYIQGLDIDDYCQAKVPSLRQRVELIQQICAAVNFSHQQLVLHRDLKPSNILVTESGQVKLLDFGIAKLTDLDEESQAQKTATQIMTRHYASPEQIQGKPVSTHSDLFSLAIIAYELITGFHPFKHKDQLEREQNLITGKVMRVSQRNGNESLYPELSHIPNSKIQGDLENILLKALSVEPEKRYSTVKEFSDDLNCFIENKPVIARKPSKFYYFTKWVQRHKAITLLTLLTLITLISATLYSIEKANFAIKHQQIAEKEHKMSKQIADLLQNMFEKARPSNGKEVTAQDLLDQARTSLNDTIEIDIESKFNLLLVLNESYLNLGKTENLNLNNQYNECVSQLNKQHKFCIRFLIISAKLELLESNNLSSIQFLNKAEKIARNNTPLDNALLSEILFNQIYILKNLNQVDQVYNKTDELHKLYEQNPNIEFTKLNEILILVTYNAISTGNYDKARSYLNKIHSVLVKNNQEKSLHMARYNNIWGTYYGFRHEQKNTIPYRTNAVEILQENYPTRPVQFGFYITNLARALYRSGEMEQGLQAYQKALEFYRKQEYDTNSKQINILVKMTLIHLINNDILKAQNEFSKVLSLGIENIADTTHQQCYFKTAATQLSVHTKPASNIENNLSDLETCLEHEDKNTIYNMYYFVIKAQLALKNTHRDESIEFLIKAENILAQFPDDYFGIRKLIADTRLKISNYE